MRQSGSPSAMSFITLRDRTARVSVLFRNSSRPGRHDLIVEAECRGLMRLRVLPAEGRWGRLRPWTAEPRPPPCLALLLRPAAGHRPPASRVWVSPCQTRQCRGGLRRAAPLLMSSPGGGHTSGRHRRPERRQPFPAGNRRSNSRTRSIRPCAADLVRLMISIMSFQRRAELRSSWLPRTAGARWASPLSLDALSAIRTVLRLAQEAVRSCPS